MEFNPYKILGVKYDDNLLKIREKFKKLVLIHHPDKGGNPYIFDMIKKSYKYLYNKKKQQEKQLSNETRNIKTFNKERNDMDKKINNGYENIQKLNKISTKNFNQNHFNKLFNHFKVEDADDRGYEIEKSTPERLDQSDILKKYKGPKKMQISVIKEPEPLELSKSNYKKLGLKHVDDFSKSHSSGQEFTDLQKAYINRDVIENNMGNTRKDSYLSNVDKQMSNLVKNRNKVKHTMNKKEALEYKIKQEEEQMMESRRQLNMSKQDEIYSRQFQRMQNYLTFE